jgi:hypothetical protein
LNNTTIHIIACATVLEEILPVLPVGMTYQELDFGLHLRPENLKQALQNAIDEAGAEVDTILLGYGLCSMAVAGLRATHCTLIVPRVDDCIAIFLGSGEAYKAQASKEPGTYYLTKGWIEVGDTILDEHLKMVERYGQEKAERISQLMLKNYTRLAYIDTGYGDQSRYRDYARQAAQQFNLRFEEIKGSNELVLKLVIGPWDDDFVIARPGERITFAQFKTKTKVASNTLGASSMLKTNESGSSVDERSTTPAP